MRYRFDRFILDVEARQLTEDGRVVHLSGKAFDLLRFLVEERPRAVEKRELYDRLWPDTFVTEASLHVLVREIRSALGDVRDAIRTVHRFGYAFAAEAVVEDATVSATPNTALHQLLRDDRAIPLPAGRNLVGRDPASAVFIPSTSVSRQHAAITVEAGDAVIEDLGSKNGTLVDGARVSGPHHLTPGAIVRFGTVEFRYAFVSDPTETETVSRGT